MRQSTVDVGNTVIEGARTEMWRVDCIGDASFTRSGDGASWTSFSGEIAIHETVKVPGFKAAGLSIEDFILLSVTPPDPQKSPFDGLRQTIPVKLATDVWIPEVTVLTSDSASDSTLDPDEYIAYAL